MASWVSGRESRASERRIGQNAYNRTSCMKELVVADLEDASLKLSAASHKLAAGSIPSPEKRKTERGVSHG